MNRGLKVAFVFLGLLSWNLIESSALAQAGPLTYPMLQTALSAKLPAGATKQQVIQKLIQDVKARKVDKPLTPDREDDLRQAGATEDLLAAIRQNSPKITVNPTPKPISSPVQTPAPTPVRTPQPAPTPVTSPTGPPQAGTVRKTPSGLEFVWVPPGDFMMGSSESEIDAAWADCRRYNNDCNRGFFANEAPKHRVRFAGGFWMGRYEVTQGEWEAVMGGNPSKFSTCGKNCPVENVNWDDVRVFINRLNEKNDGYQYYLPTEAQWEYAARAGTTTEFAYGNTLSSTQANINGERPYGASVGPNLARTVAVGSYKPNAWGLYDMHGNVFEWVMDVFFRNYDENMNTGAANLTLGDADFRVVRGGSWRISGVISRSANRNRLSSTAKNDNLGFRIAVRSRSAGQ